MHPPLRLISSIYCPTLPQTSHKGEIIRLIRGIIQKYKEFHVKRRLSLLFGTLVALILGVGFFAPVNSANASPATTVCHPDVGDWCLDPRFQAKWQELGGLALGPGYPMSPAFELDWEGHQITAQLYERAAITYDPTLAPAWQIQGALVGRSFVSCGGLSWSSTRPNTLVAAGTNYFVNNGWNLAKHGLVITDPLWQNPDQYTVQYFERARLEWQGDKVMLGRLVAEMMAHNLSGAEIIAGCN